MYISCAKKCVTEYLVYFGSVHDLQYNVNGCKTSCRRFDSAAAKHNYTGSLYQSNCNTRQNQF